MTLLVARQCRLLRTPHGAVGALQRLQRPAVTVAARSFADEATPDEIKPPNATRKTYPSGKRLDLTGYRQHQERVKKLGTHPAEKRLDLTGHHRAHKKLDHHERIKQDSEHVKRLRELSYFITPKFEDSDIVPVNSAIIIPASVTAAVSVPATLN